MVAGLVVFAAELVFHARSFFSVVSSKRLTPTDEETPENFPSELCMRAKAAQSKLNFLRMCSNNKCPHDGHGARGAKSETLEIARPR